MGQNPGGGGFVPPPPFPPPAPPPQRLHRRRDNRVFAGVCSGLADYLGADPVWVRIAFIVAAFFGGVGILAYLAGWIAMPLADPSTMTVPAGNRQGVTPDARLVIGVILLAIAALVLVGTLGVNQWGLVWGAVLVAVGVLLLVESQRPVGAGWLGGGWANPQPGAPPTSAPADPFGANPFGPAGTSWTPTNPAAAATELPDTAAPVTGPEPPAPPGGPGFTPPASPAPPTYVPYAPPTPSTPFGRAAGWRPNPRPRFFPIGLATTAAALLAVGVAAILNSSGVVGVSLSAGMGLALLVVGLGLIAGAWVGRSGWLIFCGFFLLPFAVAGSLVSEPLTGGAGQVRYAPTTVAELHSQYNLAAGQLTVDLSGLELEGDTVDVTVTDATGQVVVILPPDAEAVVDGSVGAGELDIVGHTSSGLQVSQSVTSAPPGGDGTLHLKISVGLGQVTVREASSTGGAGS